MRCYQLPQFGIDRLTMAECDAPRPGPGQVAIDVKALSLNFRDLLVIKGIYNPALELPITPVSDGAGVIAEVGPDVDRVGVGDRVMSHFVASWLDGQFAAQHLRDTLGTPGPGLAAERVLLPADAVVRIPEGIDFAQASTLPIAALTAWSGLVTEAGLRPGQTVLTLGTGGVSIFALQFGKALGARVFVTSSSDEKLERARSLGADELINYARVPGWETAVLDATGGVGVDVVVENGGIATFQQSLRAVRHGGVIALLGALTGLLGEINIAPVLMKRIRVAGVLVDCRRVFEKMVGFMNEKRIEPVIDVRYPFDELPEALRFMEGGRHFGKIVIEVGN